MNIQSATVIRRMVYYFLMVLSNSVLMLAPVLSGCSNQNACINQEKNTNLINIKSKPNERKNNKRKTVPSLCRGIYIGDYICDNVNKFNDSIKAITEGCKEGDSYCCSLLLSRNALLKVQNTKKLNIVTYRTKERLISLMSEFFSVILSEMGTENKLVNVYGIGNNELFIAAKNYIMKTSDYIPDYDMLASYCDNGNYYACVLYDFHKSNKYEKTKLLCDQNIEAMCYAYDNMFYRYENQDTEEVQMKFYCNQCDKGFIGNCNSEIFQKCNIHLSSPWRAYVQYTYNLMGWIMPPERFENYNLDSKEAEKISRQNICIYQ